MSLSRTLQYAFLAIIVTTVGFSLYQWNASRASTQKTAPNNGLVGYWSFNEGTGTQAGDASGNNNTGTLTNGPTWVTGKLGQAINFDGVNDYVLVPTDNGFSDKTYGSISALFYATTMPGNSFIWRSGQTSADTVSVYSDGTNLNNHSPYIEQVIGTVASLVGKWHHLVVTWNSSTSTVYLDGNAVGSAAYNATWGTGWHIGSDNDHNSGWHGALDEVRIYNRALSGTEVTNLYNLGAEKLNVSPVSNLTSGLVGYWTFDGKDTPWSSSSAGTATDRSGNGNTGTLTNMSRATSPAEGKLGQALNFDGVNDYVDAGGNSTYNFGTGDFSVSGWVKTSLTSTQIIISKSSADGIAPNWRGWAIFGANSFMVLDTFYYGNPDRSVGAAMPADNNFHFITATRASGVLNMYIDGVLGGTSSGATNDVSNANIPLHFGDAFDSNWYASTGGQVRFQGTLDEVRIYNRALSATEVQSLYDLGASDHVNSSVSQNQGAGRLDSGLVGYWKLDDASGTTATDSSTNANNGTLTNGPTWGTGQIGGDVVFDGVNDEVNIASLLGIGTGPLTIACWVYLTGNTNGAFVKVGNDGFGIGVGATDFDTSGNNLIGLYENVAWKPTGVTIGTNAWHHIVMRVNSSSSSTSDYFKDGVLVSSLGASTGIVPTVQTFIGGYASRHPAAYIDEVRVYNRVLSDDEVSQLYRLTTPTAVDTSLKGYWSFNGPDLSGTTAYDRSGAGNTGTLTNGPTIIEGKLGQALTFDGVNDYVSTTIPSASIGTEISISIWSKNTTTGTNSVIWGGSDVGAGASRINVHLPYAGVIYWDFGRIGSSGRLSQTAPTLTDGWHHWVFWASGGDKMRIYLDGALWASQNSGDSAGYTGTSDFYIGGSPIDALYFPGSVDEVRVYNRALTAPEITALYNSGH